MPERGTIMKKLFVTALLTLMTTATATACPLWECSYPADYYGCGCQCNTAYQYNQVQPIYCQYCGNEQWSCTCGSNYDYNYNCDYSGGCQMIQWANIRDEFGNIIGQANAGDWIEIIERLRGKWNCYDFQHFINGVKKENPRHISKQLGAIERFLDSENPDRALVADVLKKCCNNFRYQFSQFRTVYEYTKAGKSLTETDGFKASQSFDPVEYKSLDVYGKAFNDRVNSTRKEATTV